MSDLVEKVARAAWNDRFADGQGELVCRWEDASLEARKRFTAMARAALRVVAEEMKEPPSSREGQDAIWFASQLQNANDQYRAMFAASPLGKIGA